MTPLAHRIAKELMLPVKERTFRSLTGVETRMDDVHCFEMTAAHRLIEDVAVKGWAKGHFDERTAFAPFPKFWIETSLGGGRRIGFLAESIDEDAQRGLFRLTRCGGDTASGITLEMPHTFIIRLSDFTVWHDSPPEDRVSDLVAYLYGALAVINTPRLIGRKQHMPHQGLERKLAKAKGLVGKFPLHAWTEITLSVRELMKQAGEKEHEAHLTGEKCWHWCRAHLRVRLGRIELVTAHERGNPALGMKRTRYRLAA